jgi:hypothetical protein
MLSWWVGLSREEFAQRIASHNFGTQTWRFSENSLILQENRDTRTAVLARARQILKHRRSIGFEIGTHLRVNFVTDPKDEKIPLEPIPYYDWAESPVDILTDKELEDGIKTPTRPAPPDGRGGLETKVDVVDTRSRTSEKSS